MVEKVSTSNDESFRKSTKTYKIHEILLLNFSDQNIFETYCRFFQKRFDVAAKNSDD